MHPLTRYPFLICMSSPHASFCPLIQPPHLQIATMKFPFCVVLIVEPFFVLVMLMGLFCTGCFPVSSPVPPLNVPPFMPSRLVALADTLSDPEVIICFFFPGCILVGPCYLACALFHLFSCIISRAGPGWYVWPKIRPSP